MSYDLRFMLVALAGLAALYWMVVALKLRLLGQPGQNKACRLAAACASVALISFGSRPAPPKASAAAAVDPAPYEAPEPWRLSYYAAAEHDRVDSIRMAITPALELYRQTHGQYPVTLEDANVRTPQTAYGPLHYYGSRSETPHWYLISFGDPQAHGFAADWDSRRGMWQVFTFD